MRSTFRASTATITNPPSGSGPKAQPWATLKLYNAETRGGKGGNYPRFCEGENIFGRVELSLLGPHTIKNVKLVLKGKIITSAMDTGSVNFLEQNYTVWDRSFGDPRHSRPEEKFDGKLEGDYVFPFSIPFPTHVNLSTLEAVKADGQRVESQIQLAPQNAGLGGQITPFPAEIPLQKKFVDYHDESAGGEASSEQRSLAARTELGQGQSYVAPFHLDSPSSPSDPERRELRVDYTLCLANPVSYARGTVIPCYLTIACDDISALNLFSNPRSPRVRLSRAVRYLDNAGGSEGVLTPGTGFDPGSAPYKLAVLPQVSAGIYVGHLVQAQQDSASNAKLGRKLQQQRASGSVDHRFHGSMIFASGVNGMAEVESDIPEGDGTPVSDAVWWISQEEEEVGNEGARTLQGEIHLPSDLQPSCPFALFNISYCVELLAPVSHAFEPELGTVNKRDSDGAQKSRIYASQIVEITTDSRDDEPDVIALTKPPGTSVGL
ncbi:hypothetical protein EST38_g9071 [Candolleomyces aberdarensis]|uniref:Arrestin-like N-terminal domain-containing protein n=1 Tax=Candolleomyces aberdarensis TaxID=2316362 RepID=A0A4Q2DCN1_9AGAR|nr:hypothetical protein EST38_g9071 [Candolleomyces aberdarensis]